jgi:hypothetical protein
LQRALAAAGVPVLAVAHLAPVEPEDDGLAAARALRPGPTRWVAVSAPVAERLRACFDLPPGAAAVSVVPNGVHVPPEDPRRRAAARAAKRGIVGLAARAPLFVFAGRLEPNKGADLLPTMAERLHAATGGGGVAVLGSGKLLRAWESAPAAPRPGLHLLGHVPDVADWLLAADALLLPSRLEGCPLVSRVPRSGGAALPRGGHRGGRGGLRRRRPRHGRGFAGRLGRRRRRPGARRSRGAGRHGASRGGGAPPRGRP